MQNTIVKFTYNEKNFEFEIDITSKTIDLLKDDVEKYYNNFDWQEFFTFLPKIIQINDVYIHKRDFISLKLFLSYDSDFDYDSEHNIKLVDVTYSELKSEDFDLFNKLIPTIEKVHNMIKSEFRDKHLQEEENKEKIIKTKKDILIDKVKNYLSWQILIFIKYFIEVIGIQNAIKSINEKIY